MSTKLTKLKIDRIDVVDRPAAPTSKILIAKRGPDCPPDEKAKPKAKPEDENPKMEKSMSDKPDSAADEKEDAKKKASEKPEEAAEMQKRAEEIAVLKRQNLDLAQQIQKINDERERDQYIAKATDLKVLGPADAAWQYLRDISKALGAERFQKFEKTLRALKNQVDAGELFKEIGASSADDATDPWRKLEKMAADVVTKSAGAKTREQALDDILKTPEGNRLYEAYIANMPGMQPGRGA